MRAKKTPSAFLFFLPALPPLVCIYLTHAINHPILRFAPGLIYSLLFIPLIEILTGPSGLIKGLRLPSKKEKKANGKPEDVKAHSLVELPVFRAALVATVVSVLISNLHAVLSVSAASGRLGVLLGSNNQWEWYSRLVEKLARVAPRTPLQYFLHSLSLAYFVLSGMGASHEMLHKVDRRSSFERFLGWLYLSLSMNVAYFVEHHNHHMYVGTSLDSASAEKGDNVYAFMLRMEWISWTRSIRTSLAAYRRSNGVTSFVKNDRFASGVLISSAVLLGLYTILGGPAAIYFFVLGVLGTVFLDAANYMEHYGLRRKIDPSTGRLEQVSPMHSWDCTYTFSNILLFQVGAHADHHIDGTVAYPSLDSGLGPEYPYGLHCMTWVALIPPAFKKIADPLVAQLESNAQSSLKAQ